MLAAVTDLDELGHHRPACACSTCTEHDRQLARIRSADNARDYDAALERFDALELLGACARAGLAIEHARGLLEILRSVYASAWWGWACG